MDKYYTPKQVAKYCIDKTFEIIGKENITHIIEPSAGSGSFSNQLDCDAYDIEPDSVGVIKQDYLKLDTPYQKGRLVIGNPPYGVRNTLSVKFFKKSVQIADYIAFILPISQLNNTQQMYEFDLIHSEEITSLGFDGLDSRIRLCLNMYKRPSGILNKKPTYKLKDVIIIENRRGGNTTIKEGYSVGICSFGWSVGKEVEYVGQYSNEFYLYVNNKVLEDDIINTIKNANWRNIVPMTGTEKINQWQVYKYLKDNIKGII